MNNSTKTKRVQKASVLVLYVNKPLKAFAAISVRDNNFEINKKS